jgi:hypothetical protein
MNEKLWSLLRCEGRGAPDSAAAVRGRTGLRIPLVAVSLLCACLALVLIAVPGRASAAPSAPALFDEIAESEVASALQSTSDLAVDSKSGDFYVAVNNEVEKLSPYGAFILAFGREVDETKVALRKQEQAKSETVTVTAEAEDICTAASGDTCSETGTSGASAGMFNEAADIAVEQASGAVFVVDASNHRLEKFNSSGKFLLAFGMDVNTVKTKALASPPSAAEQKAANLCVAGEECQAGIAGTAEGAFESLGNRPVVGASAQVVAVGGPSGAELVYVGDKARIEVFKLTGEFVEQLSLSAVSATEKVATIAADASGDVFFGYEKVAGVHMAATNAGGALELAVAVFDGSSTGIEALGVGGSSLYVADSSPTLRMLDYEVTNPSGMPAEFANSELDFTLEANPAEVLKVEVSGVNGIAVSSAGTVGLAIRAPLTYEGHGDEYPKWPTGFHGSISLYGSLSAMEASYGAPPAVKPAIGVVEANAAVEATTATLEAQVNPELRPTTYQFEYGQEPCSAGACIKMPATPSSLGTVVKTDHKAQVTLSGLQQGAAYDYRVIFENSAGAVVGSEHVLRIGSNQQPGPAVGLPDGRIYELVSPANKHGAYVEAWHSWPAFVAPDGQSVMYVGSGALAGNSTTAGSYPLFVSQHTSKGWETRSATPLVQEGATEPEKYLTLEEKPMTIVPSDNMARLLFTMQEHAPYVGPPDEAKLWNNLYLEGSDPLLEPEWVGRSQVEGYPGGLGAETGSGILSGFAVAGTSPDLKTVYFYYGGQLFPEASRLYEYREGVLSDAGVLPEGENSSGPATPAAETAASRQGAYVPHVAQTSAAGFANQVSADGSRIFFVREDEAGTLELYVHLTEADGAQRTELVSRSQLVGHEGEPAAHGPYAMLSTEPTSAFYTEWPEHGPSESPPTYVFASSDGSHAFFQSVDQLTEDAPDDSAIKTYDFDLETGGLEYEPAITGSIVAASEDGATLIFENTTKTPFTLERWAAGPGGGNVTDVASLPAPTVNGCIRTVCLGPAYMSTDGSVITFSTEAAIPGFNDGGTHYQLEHVLGLETPQPAMGTWQNSEIFRYDAVTNELNCVSCPPQGQTSTGNAIMSKLAFETNSSTHATQSKFVTNSGRAMSADGSEVFFETPSALVPQDTNGVGDVYEWENGKIYPISSGRSAQRSTFLGVSESGEDVFFATSEGIASGDTDGAYDVYDAHVPHPGEKPVEAIPCEGSVCQGSPNVPNLLGQPASEAFSGPGNLTPTSPVVKQSKHSKQQSGKTKKRKARKACKRKRRTCKQHARKRRHAKSARALGGRRRPSDHNGRGK